MSSTIKVVREVIKDEVLELIMGNLPLRQAIAISEGLQDNSVRVLIINKSKRLSEHNILSIIKAHTGLKEKDIFEKETTSNKYK